uniref:Cytochrome c oxidase subunit 2 n=1 Tax=Xiphydria sp. ZJUH 2008002 TaxID=2488325 RepID=A0A3G5BC78_9HYME|nr:cytochrome c oxidase subunit 2 [Xiphydria sp. ZJUH 2008002]
MSTWKTLNFQDAASPMMEEYINFHDHALSILILITIIISYIILNFFINKFTNRFLMENQMIEMIWTMVPMIILIILAIPSLKILYLMDEINYPYFTIKITGNQWYWKYEYADFSNLTFNSFIMNHENLNMNNFRLLDVDNRMLIPNFMNSRLLINSSDVIHSWAVPSLGLKIDAIPGRLNQSSIFTYRAGLFFGQCSEICGLNHSFMPIVVESIPLFIFFVWTMNF